MKSIKWKYIVTTANDQCRYIGRMLIYVLRPTDIINKTSLYRGGQTCLLVVLFVHFTGKYNAHVSAEITCTQFIA